MNLAVEYLARRSEDMLTVPCALFLNTSDRNKLVVTMFKYYGDDKYVIVKHWRTWQTKPEDKLPPFSEFKIEKSGLFTNPNVIIKDCTILPYCEDPFPAGAKQHTDFPHSMNQETEYGKYLSSFSNTIAHYQQKTDWLWQVFESIYVTDDLKLKYQDKIGMDLQRDVVQFYSKPVWYTWMYWKRHLLDFNNPVAPELVFKNKYPKHVYFQPSSNFYLVLDSLS